MKGDLPENKTHVGVFGEEIPKIDPKIFYCPKMGHYFWTIFHFLLFSRCQTATVLRQCLFVLKNPAFFGLPLDPPVAARRLFSLAMTGKFQQVSYTPPLRVGIFYAASGSRPPHCLLSSLVPPNVHFCQAMFALWWACWREKSADGFFI